MRAIVIGILAAGCVGRVDGSGGEPDDRAPTATEIDTPEPPVIFRSGESDCGDGLDDDRDGLVDCLDDFDCEGFACADGRICSYGLCVETEAEEDPEPEPDTEPEPEPDPESEICPAGSDGWPCDEWGTEIDCGGGRTVTTYDCFSCRGGECVLNDGAFDEWCVPSCGHAGNVCGRGVSCAGAGAVCEGLRDGGTWDCATCCFID